MSSMQIGRITNHSSWVMVLGIDFPDFFQSDAVGLGLAALPEVELLVQLLRDMAVAALSDDCATSVQSHATLEIILESVKSDNIQNFTEMKTSWSNGSQTFFSRNPGGAPRGPAP